jgi:hypothetical protein
MAEYERPETVFTFITKDFESIWNSLASSQGGHGGNFVLCLHSMILLEWASRLASTDPTGAALADFSAELERVEPRYFIRLPSPVSGTSGFQLPSRGSDPENQLLGALYDVLRHGHAHAYHQQIVRLPGGDFVFGVAKLSGAVPLDRAAVGHRNDHLVFDRIGNDIQVRVRPDLLFLDFKRAVDAAGLLRRGLAFRNLERTPKGDFYRFTVEALEAALVAGGMQRV